METTKRVTLRPVLPAGFGFLKRAVTVVIRVQVSQLDDLTGAVDTVNRLAGRRVVEVEWQA